MYNTPPAGAAGTLSSGDGMLTYNISGTPSGTGTAAFAISFAGRSCSMSATVNTGTVSVCSSLSGVEKGMQNGCCHCWQQEP